MQIVVLGSLHHSTLNKIQMHANPPKGYSWTESTLKYKGWLVLIPTFILKAHILRELHSSSIVCHLRFQESYAHALLSFFWLGMKKDI